LLAQLWKELIEEMGGIEGGGVIIHYAHSLGGTETDRARELLTPEEQQMIQVVSIGSATMIRDQGFRNVTNYVNTLDGVCFLDPIGRIRNLFDPNSNVRLLRAHWNGWQPWTLLPYHHPLYIATYTNILYELGKQFLLDYCYQP
jgi:hypothetical protein